MDNEYLNDIDPLEQKKREVRARFEEMKNNKPAQEDVVDTEQEEPSTVSKVGGAVARGMETGVANTANFFIDSWNNFTKNMAKTDAQFMSLMTDQSFEQAYSDPEVVPRMSTNRFFGDAPEDQGALLGMTEGIAQFVLPYAGAMKGLNYVKQGAHKAKPWIAGAAADFLGFAEDNLANVVQQYPALQNPVTEFLSVEEDDSEMEKRLKGAVVGTMAAGVVETAMKPLTRGGKTTAQTIEEMSDADKEVVSDMFVQAVRATREVRKLKQSGMSEKEIAQQFGIETTKVDAVIKNSSIIQNYEKIIDEELIKINSEKVLGGVKPEEISEAAIEVAAKTDDEIKASLAETFGKNVEDIDLDKIQNSFIDSFNLNKKEKDLLITLASNASKAKKIPDEELTNIARKLNVEDVDGFKNLVKKEGALASLVKQQAGDVAVKIQGLPQLAQKAKTGDALAQRDLAVKMADLAISVDSQRRLGTEIGRALRARQVEIDPAKIRAGDEESIRIAKQKAMQRILSDPTVVGNSKTLANAVAALNGPEELIKMARIMGNTKTDQFFDAIHEVWMNSVLSGPVTHATNIFGTITFMGLSVVERSVAAGIGTVGADKVVRSALKNVPGFKQGALHGFKEGSVQHKESLNMLQGYVEGAVEAVKVFARITESDPVMNELLEKGTRLDTNLADNSVVKTAVRDIQEKIERKFTAKDLEGLNGQGQAMHYLGYLASKTVGGAGMAITAPLDFMQGSDRFLKTMAFRGEQRALARRQITNEGLTGQEAKDRYFEILNGAKNFSDTLEKVRGAEDINKGADYFAQVTTFQNEAPKIIKDLTRMRDDIPGAKYFVPFIKTPSNIFIQGFIERTPIGLAGQRLRDTIMQGGPEAQLALARLSVGTTAGVVTMDQVLQGNVTGAGPQDLQQRRNLEQTGWKQYAIKGADGKYYQYNRIEPIGMVMGIFANIAEARRYDDPLDPVMSDEQYEGFVFETLAGMSQYMSDKSFMTGISDMLAFASGDPATLKRTTAGVAVNFMPLSALGRSVAQTQDPFIKDVKEDRLDDQIVSMFYSQIPGLSKDVPNATTIFGDPVKRGKRLTYGVLPFAQSPDISAADKFVFQEIQDTFANIRPPERRVRGIKLSPREHAARMDILKSLRDPVTGLTLKEAMVSTIKSEAYQSLPNTQKNGKADALKSVYRKYTSAATDKYLMGNEDLQRRILQLKIKQSILEREEQQ